MIVYNKTRNFAGQTIGINISAMDTIKTLKEKIMEKTDIPIGIQDITFGGIVTTYEFPDNLAKLNYRCERMLHNTYLQSNVSTMHQRSSTTVSKMDTQYIPRRLMLKYHNSHRFNNTCIFNSHAKYRQ